MNNFFRSNPTFLRTLFLTSLVLTLIVYILRGTAIIAFVPGGLILILALITLITGIIYGIDKTKRL